MDETVTNSVCQVNSIQFVVNWHSCRLQCSCAWKLHLFSAEYWKMCPFSTASYHVLQGDTVKGVVNGVAPSSPGIEKNDKSGGARWECIAYSGVMLFLVRMMVCCVCSYWIYANISWSTVSTHRKIADALKCVVLSMILKISLTLTLNSIPLDT